MAADAMRAGWRVHCKPAKRDHRLRARDGFPPRAPTSPLGIADLYGDDRDGRGRASASLHAHTNSTRAASSAAPHQGDRRERPDCEQRSVRELSLLASDLVLNSSISRSKTTICESTPLLAATCCYSAWRTQVHRSYWVGRHAVASIERDGHRARLVLTTGAKIPVSRTYLPYCAKQVGFRRASPSPLKTGVPRRERLPQVAPRSLRTLQKKACGLRGFSGMSWTTSQCSTTLPPSSRKISTIARPLIPGSLTPPCEWTIT